MSALHGLYTSTEIFLWISMTITEDKIMRSLPKMSAMSSFYSQHQTSDVCIRAVP